MANTRQICGGFHMEGHHLDDQANGMDDLKRQVQQLLKHLACYETQGSDNNFGFENVNPFYCCVPADFKLSYSYMFFPFSPINQTNENEIK